jgi:ubiquinone/menaquinone biosynthesis C-methylase UbiE
MRLNTKTLPFALPPLTPGGEIPIWDGHYFHIGQTSVEVLEYSTDNKGWTDALTNFHEDTAGENHFIDRASREYTIQQIKKNISTMTQPVILEIGCSSGFMLNSIKNTFPHAMLIGADVVKEPLEKLARKTQNVCFLRFDLLNCPLPENSIDVIVMLNVLEHIKNDLGALKQVERILKPGGILLIEVPAGENLFDIYDKALMHFRRYSISSLRRQVQKTNLKITTQSHLGFFLYPGFWITKMRNKRFLALPEEEQHALVEKNIRNTKNNILFKKLTAFELFLGKYLCYPFGIRCLMTAIKPKS